MYNLDNSVTVNNQEFKNDKPISITDYEAYDWKHNMCH